MADLVAYGRANPGKINYGNQGKGQTGELLGKLIAMKGNFQMAEIPYRGSAPAINDMLAGNIDVMADYLLANKQNIDTGKLKILAVGSRERLKDYPNVGTHCRDVARRLSPTPGWASPRRPAHPRISWQGFRCDRQGVRRPEVRARILGLEASRSAARPRKCATSSKKASSSGRR